MGARRHHVALASALAAALAIPASPEAAAQTRRAKTVYGAIAYHRDSDSFGYAYDFQTERAATVAAMNQCGRVECEIVIAFRNACAAVADTPAKKPVAARGVTAAEAEQRAIKACADESCRIVAWACTR